MTTPVLHVYTDAITDLRDWLRGQTEIQALIPEAGIGARVYGRLPNVPTLPAVRLYRSGGGPLAATDAPVQTLRVAVEAIGGNDQDYAETNVLIRTLEALLEQRLTMRVHGSTCFLDAHVTAIPFMPDPDATSHRWVADVLLTCRPAGAADVPSS